MTELGLDLFDAPARERVEAMQWRLAQDVLRLGQTVVLEFGFWRRADRDAKRQIERAMKARR